MHDDIRRLRRRGLTYAEINRSLDVNIPKSSLAYICKGIVLSDEQVARINDVMKHSLVLNRQKAVAANRKLFKNKLIEYRRNNQNLKQLMQNKQAKLIALAMLYLGEGAKWKGRRGLMLGSADPMIINMYVKLLEDCFDIPKSNLRARIQYRADQDYKELLRYWSSITGIDENNFYPGYIDKRTIGKPTVKPGYHGVCAITCAGTHVQLELEQIVGIINEALMGI
jgi:DNA-binding transcriptional MerR regulator